MIIISYDNITYDNNILHVFKFTTRRHLRPTVNNFIKTETFIGYDFYKEANTGDVLQGGLRG